MLNVMECQSCGTYARLPYLEASMLPLTLVCEACAFTVRWQKIPILPKVVPTIVPSSKWLIQNDPAIPIQQQEQNQLAETQQLPDNFFRFADSIHETASHLFTQIDLLADYIASFKIKIEEYFKQHWEFAGRIKRWNDAAFLDFLHFPFASIGIECDDSLAAQYTKWVLYPSFFGTELGMPVSRTRGMNIDLVSSYSRLQFPLESNFCEALKVPQPLDLAVKGTKIVGASLPFCWQDIPGTVKDVDHTTEWPSISMRDKAAAKTWLVQHGVRPHSYLPITGQDITDWESDGDILDSKLLKDMWLVFKQTGRIGLFWQEKELREARKFAWLMCQKLKGTVVIFVSSKTDKEFYKAMFAQLAFDFQNFGSTSRFIITTPDEPLVWDAVLRTGLIVVDMHRSSGSSGVDLDILNNLYAYQGRLIVISNDPIMDIQGENHEASLVYGLAGWVRYTPPDLRHMGGYKEYSDLRDIKEFLKGMKNDH